MWVASASEVLSLALITALVTMANNAFVATCALVGSGLTSMRRAIAWCAAGLLAGLWLEGGKLIAAAESVRAGWATMPFYLALLAVGVATIAKFPASLSQALMGAAVGCSAALGLPINWAYVILMIALWGSGPVAVALIAASLARAARAASSNITPRNFVAIAKLLVGGSSFLTAYSLGANTLGLLWAYSSAAGRGAALFAVTTGSVIGALLSTGITKRLCARLFTMSTGQAISVQVAVAAFTYASTQLGVPVPVSLLTYFGVLGVAYASEVVIVRGAEVAKLTSAVLLTPLVTALAAWALALLLGGS